MIANKLDDFRAKIQASLNSAHLPYKIIAAEEVSSTNDVLKQMAKDGAEEGTALIALRQAAGKGQKGRSFVSLEGGLYMSLLLRPCCPPEEALTLTPTAAIAVCKTIEALTPQKPAIKWVNDIYVDQKKVCGIVCEACTDFSSHTLKYAVIGIGINIFSPKGGFPQELAQIAGALINKEPQQDTIATFAAELLHQLHTALQMPKGKIFALYRTYSMLIGKNVIAHWNGQKIPGVVMDIADNFELILQASDGRLLSLQSGEVTLSDFMK